MNSCSICCREEREDRVEGREGSGKEMAKMERGKGERDGKEGERKGREG